MTLKALFKSLLILQFNLHLIYQRPLHHHLLLHLMFQNNLLLVILKVLMLN